VAGNEQWDRLEPGWPMLSAEDLRHVALDVLVHDLRQENGSRATAEDRGFSIFGQVYLRYVEQTSLR